MKEFMLMQVEEKDSYSSFAGMSFPFKQQDDCENNTADKENWILRVYGGPAEVHAFLSKYPTGKYKLFAVEKVPLRISHKIKADGVDIRDFQEVS